MSGSTFRQLLALNSDNVERPRALAAGHYEGVIKGTEFGLSRQKQTPYVRLLLTPEEASLDVDSEVNSGIDLSQRELHRDFYITPKALYRISDMLDAVLGKSERSFDERIPDLRGTRVIFGVTQRENEDGTETFNDVATIIAA